MKRAAAVILALFLFALFPIYAEGGEEKGETENLWREFLAVLPDAAEVHVSETPEQMGQAVGFARLFEMLADAFTGELKKEKSPLFSILGIALAFGALALAVGGFGKSKCGKLLWEALPSLLLFRILFPVAERVFVSLAELGGFSLAASGIYAALFSAAGAPSSAAAAGGGFAVFSGILNGMLSGLLLPVLKILFVLAVLSSFGSVKAVGQIGKRISTAYLWILSLASVLFTASLALESGIAASADSVAVRTVKFAVGSSIPVVGGTVSGALGALGASLSLLKSGFGATSLVVLAALILPVFAELLLYRFTLSLASFFSESLENVTVGAVFDRYKNIFDLMLAAVSIVSLVFLILIGILSKGIALPI